MHAVVLTCVCLVSCLYGVPFVYACGRTYMCVCLVSCLYGVPCVYARGRTYMCVSSVMFIWCTIRVCTRSYLHGCVSSVMFYMVYHSCPHAVVLTWVCLVSCLYGVPFVYARGRTYMCVFSVMFVWCTIRVCTRSYLHVCV